MARITGVEVAPAEPCHPYWLWCRHEIGTRPHLLVEARSGYHLCKAEDLARNRHSSYSFRTAEQAGPLAGNEIARSSETHSDN